MDTLSYYFYEEFEDEEDMYKFHVYYGTKENQYIAHNHCAFVNEEDANEYVTWKNQELELEEGKEWNPDDELLLDKELDEGGVEDLVSMFSRSAKEDLD